MKDRILLQKASTALIICANALKLQRPSSVTDLIDEIDFRVEQLLDDEAKRIMPKEAREKISQRLLNKNHPLWDDDLSAKYEKAKEYRALGWGLGECCEKAGITRPQWYRRQNIEKYGKSRPGR